MTLPMIFRVKASSLMRMLNLEIVSAGIMRTLIGSIGLVLVASITAIAGGFIVSGMYKPVQQEFGIAGVSQTPLTL